MFHDWLNCIANKMRGEVGEPHLRGQKTHLTCADDVRGAPQLALVSADLSRNGVYGSLMCWPIFYYYLFISPHLYSSLSSSAEEPKAEHNQRRQYVP